MKERLILRSAPNGWTYLSSWRDGRVTHEMDHLSCFVPAMLALGSNEGRDKGKGEHLDLARELLRTCVQLYRTMPSGLGPEIARFQPSSKDSYDAGKGDFRVSDAKYQLRPETLESLYVVWRVTGDEQYREHAWTIFQAIERNCRTPNGYSGINDVRKSCSGKGFGRSRCAKNWDNSMQSFFFAETIKYLWLIFSPPDTLPSSEYVLSTEAHPFRLRPDGVGA
eukprot:Hpha_TRINITY_DN28053_c0_g1::TRINITY_DN28053_c0_g1_i1::g.42548::m.42548/K01230/MAN1; mannosyl-oligosaccharide alpha-1,2-mannosidase